MKQLIFPMQEQYEEYVIDESKYAGYADSISFPENEEEILEVLKELEQMQMPVTVQGGKTGITGGAVPKGGHIMNLSHMNQVRESLMLEDGTGRITVESGMNLMDLKKEIASRFRKTPMFWPPDPTETSASVGGVAACNAQGICRFLYGSTKNYIEGVRLVSYSGEVREIDSEVKMTLEDGREIRAIDAVLGKEGITGVITALTLKLIPNPESMWGIAFFFQEETDAGRFVDMLKTDLPETEAAKVAAVEYLDRTTIDLIEQRKSTMAKIKELPDVEADVSGMVYVEIHGKEESIEELAEELMEAAMVCNSDPDQAWAVSGDTEIERLRAFRHGAAETANLFIEEVRRKDTRITKFGTDMEAGLLPFSEVLAHARKGLHEAGLKGCIFGHSLENHLHVNILPENYEAYEKGKELIRAWADCTKEHQGRVIGEHGIGKLKQEILDNFIPESYRKLCAELKSRFDAENKVNLGNIIKPE